MSCFTVCPNVYWHTNLKYSVAASISARFISVTIIKISSQPWSCMPRRSMSSGSWTTGWDQALFFSPRATFMPPTHHRENYRHHRKLSILHRPMMVYMRGPSTVEGYKPCGVDGTHEDVLWDEIAFTPNKQLITTSQRAQRRVSAFAHAQEPIPVRVVAVLEPFVDQHVGRVVVERLADEFAHRETRRLERGVKTRLFRRRHCREGKGSLCWLDG
jgi:hypothetical protein